MGKRSDGVRTLEDLKLRCRVDELTGCWIWLGGHGGRNGGVPMTHVSAGVLCESRATMSAMRAAWLLSGREIEPGKLVYRRFTCKSPSCCNVEHLACGGVKLKCRSAGKRGSFNTTERLLQLRRIGPVHTPEVVASIADAVHVRGLSCDAAAAEFGVDKGAVKRIRRGEHRHQRAKVLPGASVFNMGAV